MGLNGYLSIGQTNFIQRHKHKKLLNSLLQISDRRALAVLAALNAGRPGAGINV